MNAWRELRAFSEVEGLDVDVSLLIGSAIRMAREESGITKEHLAAAVGCSGNALTRLESGADVARGDTVAKILRATAVSVRGRHLITVPSNPNKRN